MSQSDLAAYFGDDAGPVPARPEDIIETEAATRVATGAQLYEVARGVPSVQPTLLDSGWRQEDAAMPADMGYPVLPGDASEDRTRVLPSMEDPRWAQAAQGYYPQVAQPAMAEPVYVVDAQVVDNGAMPVAPGYEMVQGGGMPQQMPGDEGAGGYSWLRINPPEHVGQVSQDLVMMTHPDGYAAGQFRSLRYRLEQETNTQILVVTSPRDGDGKSVTAANLALALAEGGRIQVLLIDASLRRPAQHTLFGIRGELGLTSVLAMRQDDPNLPIDVIGITRSLCLIPSGPPVASPHAALASEAAAVLIGQIRREFRYIIVDSSSVKGPAETLAWHGLVDKYILLARAGKTTTEDLSEAANKLNRDRILGVTFIGARNRSK